MKERHFSIVITGPESSGKTTLACQLAKALSEPWTPEFARYYLEWLGRSYKKEDLSTIGKGQKSWENWYGARAVQFAIRDTDWTVLKVWEQFRFGTDMFWRKGYGEPAAADLYLLCSPDLPWQPDPLREHPNHREELFEMYRTLLSETNARFEIIDGKESARLAQAIAAIEKLSRPLRGS